MFVFLFHGLVHAECTATIVSIDQDQRTGSIMVQTEYSVEMSDATAASAFAEKIGGTAQQDNSVLKEGKSRFDEQSGDLDGIKKKLHDDINQYCEALIQRIPDNTDFINAEMLKENKSLTASLISDLQSEVGKVTAVSASNIVWKGKTITVSDDSKNSVSNITP
jgi:hypothetical protein